MNEQIKIENALPKSDDSPDNELPQLPIEPIHTNCKVCSSGFIDEIHKLRPLHTLDEISEILKKKHGVELSKSVLSYHFCRYSESLKMESARKLYAKFQADTDAIADHRHKTLFLAHVSFDHILKRLEAGTLDFGIDEFEKLVKLYHSVLRNPEAAGDSNILAIFQKASSKYGCSIEQGVLVKMPDGNERASDQ